MRTLPKAPERLYGEIGMLAFWVPIFWKILEKMSPQVQKSIEQLSEIGPYPMEWTEHWSTTSKTWLRTCSKGSQAPLKNK